MQTITQNYQIHAPKETVWAALTNAKEIEQWGAGPAIMDDLVGTNFSLWGGETHGTNTEVIINEELSQDWYGGNWDKPSHVTFTLSQSGESTTIMLMHTDIPDNEFDSISDGWDTEYLTPLKEYIEEKL